MMTYDEVANLIARESTGNECLKECHDALAAREVHEVHPVPGRTTVGSALRTFRMRSETTKAAGVSTCGFDQTLNGLAARSEHEAVLEFGFSSSARTFVVFVAESDRSIVGCVRVTRNHP